MMTWAPCPHGIRTRGKKKWWRMNGLKGLDIRDLDVKGLEPTGGE